MANKSIIDQITQYIKTECGVTPAITSPSDYCGLQIFIPAMPYGGAAVQAFASLQEIYSSKSPIYAVSSAVEQWKQANQQDWWVQQVSGVYTQPYTTTSGAAIQTDTYKSWTSGGTWEGLTTGGQMAKSNWVPKDMEELYRGPVCEKTGKPPKVKGKGGGKATYTINDLFNDLYSEPLDDGK